MKGSTHHQVHAVMTFLVAVVAGVLLIPLLRSQPEAVHKFVIELHDWQRIGFAFLLCVLYAYTMFRLFYPRIVHLLHLWTHPPAWFAWLLGLVVVGVVDVAIGLDPNGYRCTWQEWLGYAGGSIVLVAVCRRYFAPQAEEESPSESPGGLRLQNVENTDWSNLEEWLRSDAPADYDFLGNCAVAERLTTMLMDGTRSIGIVGPFGAGKTSIVKWMIDEITRRNSKARRLFVSKHSCWGFKTSASSIHEMLAEAIKTVESEIDTFHVSTLPESYRQTFSAGGEWIDTISKLLLGKRDLSEQFAALSKLLDDVNARLVFVVEDLDRNDSRSFDIQEVLAFLEQLKEHDNLSFVLTGGLDSSRQIDFAKLCDHIEYLRSIETSHVNALVTRVCQRCLDTTVFSHESPGDPDRQYLWNPSTELFMRDYEEFSLPRAAATLLNTPRSLRHALGRTFTAWHTLSLCGEIDLNHLLAVNVLRFGAPECFLFLVRRWDRLNSPPASNPTFGQERIDHIRQAIVEDWNNTIQNVEWNPTAARVVMEFILPAAESWFADSSISGSSGDAVQGVQQERYWRRAVNESIDKNDIRDQRVIKEVKGWVESPDVNSDLVTSLRTSEAYGTIWRSLARPFFNGQSDRILLLCEHVLSRIRSEEGASASYSSQGVEATWFLADRFISPRAENTKWLREQVTEASSISLELVNGLWHFWATLRPIVRPEDRDDIRRHVLEILRANLTDDDSLIARLSPDYSGSLYQLVFDPSNEGAPTLTDVASWSWLGPIILAGLRKRNVLVAANCGVLLGARVSGRETCSVDNEVLSAFFGEDASEVVHVLDEMKEQLPKADRVLVRNVVNAARQTLAGTNSVHDERAEPDAN